MQISELARYARLTPHQVRHYEREGLLQANRGANGYRDYPPHVAAQAKRVGLLVDLGFTTSEVRAFLDRLQEPEIHHQDRAARKERLANIDAAIASLRERRAELVALLVSEPSEVEE